jgi:hypothetical protein
MPAAAVIIHTPTTFDNFKINMLRLQHAMLYRRVIVCCACLYSGCRGTVQTFMRLFLDRMLAGSPVFEYGVRHTLSDAPQESLLRSPHLFHLT